MNDKLLSLSATTVLATFLWVCVAGCMATTITLLSDNDLVPAIVIGNIGCALSAAAATFQIRGFLCKFSHRMRLSFELGREVEREKQEATRGLHRV